VSQLQTRIDELLGIDRSHGETLQGQRYTAGQEFRPHNDWFAPASPAWATEHPRGGQRAFTAMVYLNDVADGGETEFSRLDIAVSPRAGTLLVWNNADENGVPNPWTVHAGKRFPQGAKYIVTKWYRAGRWF
jgi:prolyl 4-hydroxylase